MFFLESISIKNSERRCKTLKIDKDTRVEIEYTCKLDTGEIITGDPKEGLAHHPFIFGQGQMLPALEERLKGLKPNDQIEVTLSPDEAFGKIREDLIKETPRNKFPPNLELKEGHRYETRIPSGEAAYFTVRNIKEDGMIVLDFNHPLAGETLHFDITVRSVRPASTEELSKA